MLAHERATLVYPDSDGKPIAENTLQYEWIVTLKGNLDRLLPRDFVAGDLLWYPVEGRPDVRRAPDVLVAIGRPKGHRGSYKQWEEAEHPPDVVIEVMSPGNTVAEMLRKMDFYQRFGVREFVLVDPEHHTLQVWARRDGVLLEVEHAGTWTSALVPLQLTVGEDGELRASAPDGAPYRTFAELADLAERADAEAERADAEAERADAEAARAERLAARLRELGVDPDAV